MRLFLASQNLEGYPEKLVELVGKNKKMIYIGNAKDDWSPADRQAKFQEHKQQFSDLGFDVEELDLRDYFEKKGQLETKVKDVGLIWLSGGNTYILNQAVRKSGLDKILLDKLAKDEVVFGGSSAGSIMATPDLEGADWEQDRQVAEKMYGDIIMEGLDLVPFRIVPHFKSDWAGEEAQAMADYLDKKGLEYKALQDGQVLVVNGDKMEVLK